VVSKAVAPVVPNLEPVEFLPIVLSVSLVVAPAAVVSPVMFELIRPFAVEAPPLPGAVKTLVLPCVEFPDAEPLPVVWVLMTPWFLPLVIPSKLLALGFLLNFHFKCEVTAD